MHNHSMKEFEVRFKIQGVPIQQFHVLRATDESAVRNFYAHAFDVHVTEVPMSTMNGIPIPLPTIPFNFESRLEALERRFDDLSAKVYDIDPMDE